MGTENACGPEASSTAGGPRFYRFQDASGRLHLVDSIDSVPAALRSHASCVQYPEEHSSWPAIPGLGHGGLNGGLSRGLSGSQTFGLGFAAALVVAFVFSRLPGSLRLVFRIAIVGGVIALFAGAYFGWLRREAHQSTDTFAGPGALLDDAKQAVEKMNARVKAQQAELKEVEQAK